jgi:hypothetical protein
VTGDPNALDVIQEVRAIRERISAQFDHDLHRYAEYLRIVQSEFPNPVITRDDADGGAEKKPAA